MSGRPKARRDAAGLETRPRPAYGFIMDAAAEKTPPRWLVESLERSETQIAAGQSVPLEPLHDRIRASIARMRGQQPQTEAAPTAWRLV